LFIQAAAVRRRADFGERIIICAGEACAPIYARTPAMSRSFSIAAVQRLCCERLQLERDVLERQFM
jgi:hypothetical protein